MTEQVGEYNEMVLNLGCLRQCGFENCHMASCSL